VNVVNWWSYVILHLHLFCSKNKNNTIKWQKNRTTRHMACSNSCPLQSNSNKAIQTTYYILHKTQIYRWSTLKSEKICEVNTFYGTLELWKGTIIYSVGKRIPTVNYLLTKEIGTYTANGLAFVEFKFMTTSVLAVAGAKNKQVIKINTNLTKNNFITPKQISMESSKF